MKSDFDMIIKRFPGNENITVIPVSDVHLGAAEHMSREWVMFCDKVLQAPNTYITLGGDLINNGLKNSVTNVYEETIRPREQKRMMAEMLEPLRSRILCAVSGNHERRSLRESDDDPVYDIMCKLDLEDLYRENLAFIKIQVGDQNGCGERNPTYMLAVTHGDGGSVYTGASSVKAERFGLAIDGIDALIVGHVHKPLSYPSGKIYVDKFNNRISIKPWRVIVASSWMGYSSYAMQKMLAPTVHCLQEIQFCGDRKEIKVLQ